MEVNGPISTLAPLTSIVLLFFVCCELKYALKLFSDSANLKHAI